MSQQAKQPINSVDTPTYWIDNTSKNSASIAEEAQEEVVQQQTKKSKNNNNNYKPRKVD